MLKNKNLFWVLLLMVLSGILSVFLPSFSGRASADHIGEPVSAEFDAEGNIVVTISADETQDENYTVTFQPRGDEGNYLGTTPNWSSICNSEITNVSLVPNQPIASAELVINTANQAGQCVAHSGPFNIEINTSNAPITDDPNSQDETIPTCESQGGSTAWIACPIINLMLGAIRGISTFMAELLSVKPISATDTENPIFKVWSNVRNIALGVLVIATLIAIFGQTLGVDAYTVKKMVPRIGIGALLIMMSFYICAILIDLFNVLGVGIQNLMLQAVEGFDITVGVGNWLDGIVLGLAAGGLIAVAISPAILATIGLILLPVVLAFLTALLTVVLRQIVIIGLVVVAPLAFAAWILPTTDKWFKRWYGTFSTMLMMFPLIMIVLGAGVIYAVIVTNGGNLTSSEGINTNNLANYLLAIAGLGISMGMIPFTMRASSGILKGAVGAINNPNKGPIDRLRKGMQARREFGKEARKQDNLKKLGDLDRTNPKGKSLQKGWLRATTGTFGYGRGYKGLQRAEAVTGARSTEQRKFLAEAKAEEEQGKIADFQLQREIDQRRANGESMDTIKDSLEQEAQQDWGSVESMAKVRQLITLRAVPELERLFEASAGSEQGRQAMGKITAQNFGTIDGFAAHLTRGQYKEVEGSPGSYEFAGGYEALSGLTPEQLATQKPEVIASAARYATTQNPESKIVEKLLDTYSDALPHQRSSGLTEAFNNAVNGQAKIRSRDAEGRSLFKADDPSSFASATVPVAPKIDGRVVEKATAATQGKIGPSGQIDPVAAPRVTRQQVAAMTPENVTGFVESSGGYQALHQADLLSIANEHGGTESGNQARAELNRRGVTSTSRRETLSREAAAAVPTATEPASPPTSAGTIYTADSSGRVTGERTVTDRPEVEADIVSDDTIPPSS